MSAKEQESNMMSCDLLALVMDRTIFGVKSMPNVSYQRDYYNAEKSDIVWNYLKELPFEPIWITRYGRKYTSTRKQCVFVDPDIRPFLNMGHPWTQELLEMKEELGKYLDAEFNCVLLTYYVDGYTNRNFERDNLLDPTTPTCIISFGASRNIEFNQRRKVSFRLNLEHGSLLVIRDRKWTYDVPIAIRMHEPTITLTFKKIKSSESCEIIQHPELGANQEDTNQIKLDINQVDMMHVDIEQVNSNAMGDTPQLEGKQMTSTPIVSPLKRNFEEWLKDQTSKKTLIEGMTCGNMLPNKCIDESILQNIRFTDECFTLKTLKEFWLGNQTCISVELYKSKLQIQIRDFYDRYHIESGIIMNLLTFYELGRKISNIDHSLHYTSDSTIINNSLLCIVKHNTLLLKQFSDLHLLKDEIRFNSQELKKFKECLCQVEDFIIDYVFTEQLEVSVCCSDIPYEHSMESAFQELKKLIQQDLKWTFRALYPTHILNTQNKDENPRNIPHALKMLCQISTIQEEFLIKNNLLAQGVYDFKQLYMELKL